MLSHSVMSNSLWPQGMRPLQGSSVHQDLDSPGKNIRVGCHTLLQGIFPTQGSNTGNLHRWQIVYHLSHQGSPRILEWVSLLLLQGNFQIQELNQGTCIAGRFFTRWATWKALFCTYLVIMTCKPEVYPMVVTPKLFFNTFIAEFTHLMSKWLMHFAQAVNLSYFLIFRDVVGIIMKFCDECLMFALKDTQNLYYIMNILCFVS